MSIPDLAVTKKIAISYLRECQRYNLDFKQEQPCLAVFSKDKKDIAPGEKLTPYHLSPLPDSANAVLSEVPATSHYFTSGTFKIGSLEAYKGRSKENLVRVLYLIFDCDLKSFIKLSRPDQLENFQKATGLQDPWQTVAYSLSDEAYEGWMKTHREKIIQTFNYLNFPYSRIISSGWGHYVIVDLDEESQYKIDLCRQTQKEMIDIGNITAGGQLFDIEVSDPGTRFTRIPGSLNQKNTNAIKEVYIVEEISEYDPHNIDSIKNIVDEIKEFPTGKGKKKKVGDDEHEDDYVDFRKKIARQIIPIMAKYWNVDGTHRIVYSLSGFLRQRPENWTLKEVNVLMWDISKSANYAGSCTSGKRPGAMIDQVESTFRKSGNEGKLKGASGLKEFMTPEDLKSLMELFKEVDSEFNIRGELDKILQSSSKQQYEKECEGSDLIWNYLLNKGIFITTGSVNDKMCYYFDNSTKCLYDLMSDSWARWFSMNVLAGIGSDATISKAIRCGLIDRACCFVKSSEITQFSSWDKEKATFRLAINNSEFISVTAGEIKLHVNGENSIFFEADRNLGMTFQELMECDVDENYYANTLVEDLSFSTCGSMSVKEAKCLWKKAILGVFFRAFLQTRPIIWFTGTKGSGKTTAARLLLRSFFGAAHPLALDDVAGLPQEPMQGIFQLVSKIETHPVCCFDNYDVRLAWVVERLCRYATGCTEEYRVYFSQKMKRFRVTSQLMMSSIVPPARESDLIDRTVFFEFENPKKEFELTEEEVYGNIDKNRAKILRSMINAVQKQIPELVSKERMERGFASSFRMGSWAELCMRLSNKEEKEILKSAFKSLRKLQTNMSAENEPLVSIIYDFMKDQKDKSIVISANDLHIKLRNEIESSMGSSFKSNSTFKNALLRAKPILLQYNIELQQVESKEGKAMFSITLEV